MSLLILPRIFFDSNKITQNMNRLTALFIALTIDFAAYAQKEDPVLFTVGKTPVNVSEFEYIYAKTNGRNADFSRESLQEYLDLYVKFKLKVQRAREMQLDTIAALKEELDGYRKQLADSYLINREVTERLVREAYERSAQDVEVHHILFAVSPEAAPEDTLAAYRKALSAKKQLESGEEDFAGLAGNISDDKSAAQNGGRIGYLNVLFPNGFYALETAAYTLPLNKISDPIRTSAGYHLLKVTNRRPARGELEIAHILLRKDEWEEDPQRLKALINSYYERLKLGDNFETLCQQVSHDRRTAEKGGYLGFFGINRYEQAFEDAAFAIPADGGFSEPIETTIGWHIIKRISKKPFPTYELARPQLEAQIKRDGRFDLARKAMIETIKKTNGFKENPAVLDKMAKTLTDTFFTFRWKAPANPQKDLLFTLGNQRYTLENFHAYLVNASRERMRLRETPIRDALQSLYNGFVEETCMRFEEQQLEVKYPDFKSLLREYEEGILLFEATRMEVWDKAAQDTSGLEAFFSTIKGKYRWNERAELTKYYVEVHNMSVMETIRQAAAAKTKEAMLAQFNTTSPPLIAGTEGLTLERDKSQEALDIREWKPGEVTMPKVDRATNQFYFYKVEHIIPPQDKELSDARGYVVADYQDYLERQWVESLRKTYEVKIDQSVFEKMIRQK